MDEKTSLWNKPVNDLTVADAVKINLAIPAIMVGGVVVIGVVATVKEKATSKIQEVRKNRRHLKTVEQ